MQTLFILDYSGTLTVFRDPAKFVQDLKWKYPGAKVVIYTGTERAVLEAEAPTLVALVDDVWIKPQMLHLRVADMALDYLVIADDEPFVLTAQRRMFRNANIPTIEYLTPLELRSMVP